MEQRLQKSFILFRYKETTRVVVVGACATMHVDVNDTSANEELL